MRLLASDIASSLHKRGQVNRKESIPRYVPTVADLPRSNQADRQLGDVGLRASATMHVQKPMPSSETYPLWETPKLSRDLAFAELVWTYV